MSINTNQYTHVAVYQYSTAPISVKMLIMGDDDDDICVKLLSEQNSVKHFSSSPKSFLVCQIV